jgi:23S rRNA pseudouridine1911/1915/1917 synthase
MENIKVPKESNNQRIDKFLNDCLDESRSTIQAMLQDGSILVNDIQVKNNYKVKTDDEIIITEIEATEIELEAEDIPLDIVYQDDEIIIVFWKWLALLIIITFVILIDALSVRAPKSFV